MKPIDADIRSIAWVCDADAGTVELVTNVLHGIIIRHRSHDFVGNPNVLTSLLGRGTTTVDQYLANQARLRGIS